MVQSATAHMLNGFFEAPLDCTTWVVKGNCHYRGVCIKQLMSKVPSEAIMGTGVLGYGAIRSIIVAACQIFRLIACRKGACKSLGENLWRALDCLNAIVLVLLASVIRAIRCVLGVIFHPVIAANK